MTRETRVGLLLGLAIIIAIGMILSEVTQPGATDDQSQPTAINGNYYRQQDAPLEEVAFRPADTQNQNPIIFAANHEDEEDDSLPSRVETRMVRPVEESHSRRLASARILRHDETPFAQPPMEPANQRVIIERPALVEASQQNLPAYAPPQPQRPTPAHRTTAQTRTYTVQPGDSLYKIAQKEYGQAGFYKKIYDANRDKMNDPSHVVVGQELVIPTLASQPRAYREIGETRISLRDRQALNDLEREIQSRSAPRQNTRTAPAGRPNVYVVRRGDNLTRIAGKTLNDTSSESIRRLYEANKDKLDDPDSIVVGMKLKIPS